MNFYNIRLETSSWTYILDRISGSLVKVPKTFTDENLRLPKKLEQSLELCHKPYELVRQSEKAKCDFTYESSFSSLGKRAVRIVKLCHSNFFWLAHQYASFAKPCFEDSHEAINFFRKQSLPSPQNTLCLSRSIFAASASRRFADSGAIFIGVFLPTRNMHAWIIEDGRQPDLQDSMWINFRPVAALC